MSAGLGALRDDDVDADLDLLLGVALAADESGDEDVVLVRLVDDLLRRRAERVDEQLDAVVLERDIVMPEGAPNLVKALTSRGYRCHELPMSEFLKAGGACKCLTMFLPQREKC